MASVNPKEEMFPNKEKLLKLREEGKEYFQKGNYKEAIRVYTDAINIAKELGDEEIEQIALNNRSNCFSRLEMFENALADAMNAIDIKPSWVKAYHRAAQTLAHMKNYDKAFEMYEKAKENCEEKELIDKQIVALKRKVENLSAVEKVNAYVKTYNTIIGCKAKLSLSMFADESEDGAGLDAALGEGNYSLVYKVRFKQTNEIFALKVIDKKKSERLSRRHPNLYNEIQMEKSILNRLYDSKHPNVIKLYHTFQDNSNLYFLSELANGGELWHKLRYGKDKLIGLRPSIAKFYLAQALNGLNFLAEKGVIHRDLKPENLLLHYPYGKESRVVYLKFIDFGTAYDQVDSTYNGPNFVGTPEYMSPETVDNKPPTSTVDIWAFGAIAYQLRSGRVPFKGGSPYLTFLKIGKLLYDIPEYFEDSLAQMLKMIFQEDPEARPSAKDLKTAKYFTGIDFQEILAVPKSPIPSLYEICVEKVDDLLNSIAISSKNRSKWVEALQPGCFAGESPNAQRTRLDLMAYLDQRCTLGNSKIFPLFYGSKEQARFCRATATRNFIGLSEYEHGKFKKSFIMINLSSCIYDTNSLTLAIEKLNTLEPRPKLLLVTGDLAQRYDSNDWKSDVQRLQGFLTQIQEDIPIVTCPDANSNTQEYTKFFGNDYYSFFVGGVMMITINSSVLYHFRDKSDQETLLDSRYRKAKEHAVWLEERLLHAKFCALHVVILSYHSWNGKDKNGFTMPQEVIDYFLPKMQEAGTQVLLCGFPFENHSKVLLPATDLNPKLRQVSTSAIDTNSLRVFRVSSDGVAADVYKIEELPSWLAIEEDPNKYLDDQKIDESSDDSISSDSE